jgi:Bacterial SH3 domain
MNYTAYVSTKEGGTLFVRSKPDGERIGEISNGTEVTVTGEAVSAGGRRWSPIGTNRWVASEFLIQIQRPKVVAKRTQAIFGYGLRIYQTRLIDSTGKVIDTVQAVSGRINNQTPSHTSGSEAPLPFGIYMFTAPGVVEYKAGEFGGVWSPVTPTFKTGRSEIGVHYDPSAKKKDNTAGTAGCFATPTEGERDRMTKFIKAYKPTHLIVYEG